MAKASNCKWPTNRSVEFLQVEPQTPRAPSIRVLCEWAGNRKPAPAVLGRALFTLSRPTPAAISRQLASADSLPAAAPQLLTLNAGLAPEQRLPFAFSHDLSRSTIGHGPAAFATARHAFQRWATFDLGWVRVANPSASIAPNQLVAVEAHTLGLWTLNLSRILEAIDTPTRFGFLYSTTALHVEEGEERFLLEFDEATGQVSCVIEAVSRPRSPLARLGLPFTRHYQHRFARDSHRRMQQELLAKR
jgi:uncharacterized protein (UPF0548 family)